VFVGLVNTGQGYGERHRLDQDGEPTDVHVLAGLRWRLPRRGPTGVSSVNDNAPQCRPQHLPVVTALQVGRWHQSGGEHMAHCHSSRCGWKHRRDIRRCSCCQSLGTCPSTRRRWLHLARVSLLDLLASAAMLAVD
jgi:hypothetical protein